MLHAAERRPVFSSSSNKDENDGIPTDAERTESSPRGFVGVGDEEDDSEKAPRTTLRRAACSAWVARTYVDDGSRASTRAMTAATG